MALTPMTTFTTADDGANLAVHLIGAGPPLLCLPGGPLLPSSYLGDLGDLASHRRLVLLDLRGSGASDRTDDPTACRCDRLVADVEAVRRHLGLESIDLLAHSAGANLAYRYAEHHPVRVARLVLVAPSVFGLGSHRALHLRPVGHVHPGLRRVEGGPTRPRHRSRVPGRRCIRPTGNPICAGRSGRICASRRRRLGRGQPTSSHGRGG